MTFEELLLNGAAQNAPLALAMVWAFQRIETKLDAITSALLKGGSGGVGAKGVSS